MHRMLNTIDVYFVGGSRTCVKNKHIIGGKPKPFHLGLFC